MTYKTSLKAVVAPAFYDLHRDIKANSHTHYFIKGGRGSTKSSFVSIEIIYGLMADENSFAIVHRKYGTDLKESVYNQLLWAIDILGVSDYWKMSLSPLKLTYKPTGQYIQFRGVDDPNKSKSIKLQKGFFKFIWYEEADQFEGMEEIRKINQSLMRAGNNQKVFYTYNPPKSMQNWLNSEVMVKRDDRLINHSKYLDVPHEWLGELFFIEAEYLKQTNETSYNHEYMGEVTGTGGQVFENVTIREITESEIETFDKIDRGLDFGFTIDPCSYVACHLHKNKLYIFYEFYKTNAGYDTIAEEIRKENTYDELIYADSAEPRSVYELAQRKLKITTAIKGKGSVNFGIRKLQDLEEIVIDDIRCPNTAKEFLEYEVEKDRNGVFKAEFPDKNNHAIDATRYALCMFIQRDKQAKETPHYDFDFQKPKPNPYGVGSNPNKLSRW